MNRQFTIATVSALFLFAALGSFAQDPRPTETPDKADPEIRKERLERIEPFDGEVEFPEVEGWRLSKKTKYPHRELGYSVNYESQTGGRVTVYVYKGGVSSIPNALTGPVAAQMRQAKSEIQAIKEAGYYESVSEVSSSTIILGGPEGKVEALYSLYLITIEGRDLDSEIYVFPYENHFIKLRATRLKGEDGPTNEAVEKLLFVLDTLFSH